MRVILDLPEDVLENLGIWAKDNRQSRKGFMEKILIDFKPQERITVQDVINHGPDKKTTNLDRKNASGVKTQDLTNQSKTNYSIDTNSDKVGKQRNAFMSDAIKKKLGL